MKVTKEVPVLSRLFGYSWSELQWLLTGVQGLRSAQAKAALGLPRALTSQQGPTTQKAFYPQWPSPPQCSALQIT